MPKELTLPSGKIAIIEKGKGKDLLQAQIKAKTSDEIPYALIAELVVLKLTDKNSFMKTSLKWT